MDALEQARAEIDAVDTQLAALFERRMAAVLQVAEYKRAHGLPIYDAARETAVLEKAGKFYTAAERIVPNFRSPDFEKVFIRFRPGYEQRDFSVTRLSISLWFSSSALSRSLGFPFFLC